MSVRDKVLGLLKRYGPSAKFAVKTALKTILPNAGPVLDLVDGSMNCAREISPNNWDFDQSRQPPASPQDLQRVENLLNQLDARMGHVLAQLAGLETMPDVANQILDMALATDERCQQTAHDVQGIARSCERQEEHLRRLCAGQDEMLPLMQRLLGVADFIDELKREGFSVSAFATQFREYRGAAEQFSAGHLAEAEAALARQADALPRSASVAVALAATQTAAHDFLRAETSLSRAVHLRPGDAELGDLHRRLTVISRRGTTPAEKSRSDAPRWKEGDVFDGWTLERLLGWGGWGMVFRAKRRDQVCALKMMHPDLSTDPHFVESFKREMRLLMRLDPHVNLIHIVDHDKDLSSGSWYFVMPFIDGLNLQQHLERHGAMELDNARELFVGLAEGLAVAHNCGVVHRDIKPQNILIRGDRSPVLVDFGLAALEGVPGYTRPMGYTALFVPPEQIRTGRAGARGDVYSLAATLYFALLFDQPDRRSLFKARHAPDEVRDLLMRCLDNDPDERPDIEDFLEALRRGTGVRSNELVVSAAGDAEYRSITAALEAADPGMIIRVRPGVYSGGLTLDRPIEVIGEGPREAVIIDADNSDCILMETDKATVRGFTLRNRSGSRERKFYGVDVPSGDLLLENCDITCDSLACVAIHGSAANATLRDCVIHHGKASGIYVWDSASGLLEGCDIHSHTLSGVEVKENSKVDLRRCFIHDNTQAGAHYHGGASGTMIECDVHSNSNTGVAISTGAHPHLENCHIHDGKQSGVFIYDGGSGSVINCEIETNQLSGIEIKEKSNPVVRDCRVHDGNGSGIFVNENGLATIENCDIYANAYAGISVSEGANPTIRDCQVHDGKQGGIFIYDRGSGTIEGCAIFANTNAGLEIKKAADPVIRDCEIYDGKGSGVYVYEDGAGTIEGCDIRDNGRAGVTISENGNPTFRRCTINRNGYEGVWVYKGGRGTVVDCDLTDNKRGAWDIEEGCNPRRRGNRE